MFKGNLRHSALSGARTRQAGPRTYSRKEHAEIVSCRLLPISAWAKVGASRTATRPATAPQTGDYRWKYSKRGQQRQCFCPLSAFPAFNEADRKAGYKKATNGYDEGAFGPVVEAVGGRGSLGEKVTAAHDRSHQKPDRKITQWGPEVSARLTPDPYAGRGPQGIEDEVASHKVKTA